MQILWLPPDMSWIIPGTQIRNTSAQKDPDQQVGICDLSDVWTLVLLCYCCCTRYQVPGMILMVIITVVDV